MTPKSPHISRYMQKKYSRHTVISLDGKIIGIGKNCTIAVENAKKKVANLEDQEYLISYVYPERFIGGGVFVRER